LQPHRHEQWVIPPEQNAEFVADMEDVLAIYQKPYDPKQPLICMDEKPIQLIEEIRTPLPMQPGQVQRQDYEYKRRGTAVGFMFTEPLSGWRKVRVRERKTALDWAQEIRELLEVDYPAVEKVILVCDNLNVHKVASLYKAFPPQEAMRLRKRLEIHYTPKHGSWLNIAEIELSVLARQCLQRRIADLERLRQEVKSWSEDRNARQKGVDWQFTTEDARIKLKHLYPEIQLE
jgi:hypothetical protein